MLSFKEVRDTIQKRYGLNICEAGETAKSLLEDNTFKTEQDLINYLDEAEKAGAE